MLVGSLGLGFGEKLAEANVGKEDSDDDDDDDAGGGGRACVLGMMTLVGSTGRVLWGWLMAQVGLAWG